MPEAITYLVEMPNSEREPNALRRFLECPTADGLLAGIELQSDFFWCILNLPKRHLAPDEPSGDVDLIAGRLAWNNPNRFAEFAANLRRQCPNLPQYLARMMAAADLEKSGGVQWPPPFDYLVCIEAKCAYLSKETGRVKSCHADPTQIRGALKDRLMRGFDRVAQLDIIVNPPADGVNFEAWMNAAETACFARYQMATIFAQRLHPDFPAGHCVISMGAVAGGDETMRGAGGAEWLRKARTNPYLAQAQTQSARCYMESTLTRILGSVEQPRLLPAIIQADSLLQP